MRRFIALVLCIALCFGLFAVPSSAMSLIDAYEYTAVTLWDAFSLGWEYIKNGFAWLGDLVAPSASDLSTAYDSYVSDLDNTKGTHIIGDSYFILPLLVDHLEDDNGHIGLVSTNNLWSASFSGNEFHAYGNYTDDWFVVVFKLLSAPVAGTYSFYKNTTFDSLIVQDSWNSDFFISSHVSGDVLGPPLMKNRQFWARSSSSYATGNIDGAPYYKVTPSVYDSNTFIPVSSRAPSMLTSIMQVNTTNNSYYIGTKDNSGAVTNVYTTNIFNEETKVFTVPGDTPVTYNITNWNYDYSTRTYNCTDGTNNYVVTYGDDYITVTVPDGSGGTTSTDYYYVHQTPVPTPAVPGSDTTFPDSSSDNYEDDPNTTGGFFSIVWKAFKDGLASLIAGIIKGLFKGIKALIDGITFVFSDLVSGFFGFVTSFFNSFGTGPGSVGQFFGGGVVDLG